MEMQAEKVYTLELNEQEMNCLWSALNTAQILGQSAPTHVSVMAKVQQAVNPPVPAPEPVSAPEDIPTVKEPVIEAKAEAK